MTSKRQYYHHAIFVTICFTNVIFALQQLGDITDNVSIALADTDMLFDFEPPTIQLPQQSTVRPLQATHTRQTDHF